MRYLTTLTLLVLAVLLTSCMASIRNIENTPVPTASDGSRPTAAEVERAILTACNERGWAAGVQGEGVIAASLLVRSHMAAVEIRYTEAAFSITYKDSANLSHLGGQIHRNYNRWVLNLYRTIMRNLGSHAQNF